MLQYYTLEEAAKVIGVKPDHAKKLLDDNKVRQYRDGRGGVRYVASAVDELARTLGRGSEPELPLGEAPRAKTGNSPRPAKAAKEPVEDKGTFDFNLPVDDSEVAIGGEKLDQSGSASKRSSRGRGAGSKSPAPKSPAPQAGSDSDVRLVTEGSADFQISVDSDVKMVDESAAPSSSKSGTGSKSGARKNKGDAAGDSEVRIVPMDLPGDSDVRVAGEPDAVELDAPGIKKHSDSDIRLEEAGAPRGHRDEGSDESIITEEIDLDAEERKAAQTARSKGRSKLKKGKSEPALPTTSPFELSDSDLDAPAAKKAKNPDSSSDFELTPAAELSDESIELSSGEMQGLPSGDSSEEEVSLGELSGAGAGTSGINLDAPMDSGISLEQGTDSSSEEEFELSLDANAGATPKPAPRSGKSAKKAPAPEPEDSDSEFELTLDADSSAERPMLQPAAEGEDSDSEFELTLDDSGGLVPLEGDKAAASAEESDIFETDFEVPALDEESGSEAVALDDADTDLESSDFDLALDEGDAAADEASGSQVVALEGDEEADEAAETVQRPSKKKARKPAAAGLAEGDVGEMLEGAEEEPLEELAGEEEAEEGIAPTRAPAVAAAAVPWGPMPALVLLPCVIVMLLAGLMGYELINNMVGYQQPGKVSGFLAHELAKTFGMDLPTD